MQLYVQWFIFFVGINYIALGWFAGHYIDPVVLSGVAILLSTQCVLGVWLSLSLRRWFIKTGADVTSGHVALPNAVKPPVFSTALYANRMIAGCIALVAVVVTWILVVSHPVSRS